MQIATPAAPGTNTEDDEEESITLTIVPPTGAEYTTTAAAPAEDAMEDQTEKPETPVQMMYAAVSACSNLHPDPMEEDDEEGDGEGDSLMQSGFVTMGSADGGLPPPMDGSSGWITAENMHEYFDEEGNWIGGGEEPSLPLGPGAGTVRQREGEGAEGGDEQGEDEDTKWRRTD
jgi:nucleotide-sensitive chloride channel 1A